MDDYNIVPLSGRALWWDVPQASSYATMTTKVTGVPHVVVDHGAAGLSICSQVYAKEKRFKVVQA